LFNEVEDGFYRSNRFFAIDTSVHIAIITDATTFKDANSVFANMDFPNGSAFTSDHLASMMMVMLILIPRVLQPMEKNTCTFHQRA